MFMGETFVYYHFLTFNASKRRFRASNSSSAAEALGVTGAAVAGAAVGVALPSVGGILGSLAATRSEVSPTGSVS